ncbi:hypothetical protein IL972_17100 [Acinetobacter sp. FL51]|uniref:hypothetical protein n=1 Tax=Acinetobacter sp. FL51 TaxID=2777978 RepID=UPI0018E1BC4F|nr:hypothetical protein [Acinetobacter sp. FL51]MBI1453615.1 hypothetical protein [Acinetobacter sp. FL51]
MSSIGKLEKSLITFNSDLMKEYIKKGKRKEHISQTSIGGMYNSNVHRDGSGQPPNPIANQLESALLRMGPINTRSPICHNIIGCCCEVRVSNHLILKQPIPHKVKVKDIIFTKARRVRTNQYMKRCKNCISVFGREK